MDTLVYTPEPMGKPGKYDIVVVDASTGHRPGLHGRYYGIETVGKSLADIERQVDALYRLMWEWDQNTFYVTRIGCGDARYDDKTIAPLFRKAFALYNTRFPESFARILQAEDG